MLIPPLNLEYIRWTVPVWKLTCAANFWFQLLVLVAPGFVTGRDVAFEQWFRAPRRLRLKRLRSHKVRWMINDTQGNDPGWSSERTSPWVFLVRANLNLLEGR
jgi:hypothetical protein